MIVLCQSHVPFEQHYTFDILRVSLKLVLFSLFCTWWPFTFPEAVQMPILILSREKTYTIHVYYTCILYMGVCKITVILRRHYLYPCSHLFMNHYKRNISSRFSRNSEAFASKFLENLEEMLLQYYKHSDVISRFKYPTTHYMLTWFMWTK